MKTQMQQTSLEVFFLEVLPSLNQRQREVLKVFLENPAMDFTNTEVSVELGWSINRVTPRVYELRGLGKMNPHWANPILVESRRRLCRVTEHKAIAWSLNPDNTKVKLP